MQNTKIVWSLEGSSLQKYCPEKIAHYPYQALRIIYKKENSDEILKFLRSYKKELSASYKPVIVDLSHRAQANVINLKEAVSLEAETKLSLVPEGKEGGIQVKTASWSTLFKEKELVYLNNGNVILSILKVEKNKVETVVLQGREIRNEMELTIPSSKNHPSLFDLAFIDIKSFLGLELDYVILPGLSTAREINIIQKKLCAHKKNPPSLLIKVDSLAAYKGLKETLPLVSGLMISRRSLALSTDPATVPLLSKEIIHEANKQAKISLVSSEMLYSMRWNPTPTRAEVSDIANAVLDGIDAIVLSKDIPLGHNTLRSLSIAEKTIQEVEKSSELTSNWVKDKIQITNHLGYLAYYACLTAERVGAKALVCLTKNGNTARQIASYRPSLPIIALTFNEKTKAKISLLRGVSSIVLEGKPVLDKVLPTVKELLKRGGKLKTKDVFVFVTLSLSPIAGEASNLFTVQEIN